MTNQAESKNLVPDTGLVLDVADHGGVSENNLDGVLQVVNRLLDAGSGSVRTAREVSELDAKVCNLGLQLLKLTLDGLKSI